MNSFDIIGDIHGHADALKSLLLNLGYERHGEGYRHSNRQVVFVGDFFDRGPAIGDVVRTARAMVDAGDAFAVMGNHEYNAIAFHTSQPGRAGQWFRPHSDKNLKQHQATLDQLSPQELGEAITWFKTLPVAIEIGGIRVAHASWQARDIDCIKHALTDLGDFSPEFLASAEQSDNNSAKSACPKRQATCNGVKPFSLVISTSPPSSIYAAKACSVPVATAAKTSISAASCWASGVSVGV